MEDDFSIEEVWRLVDEALTTSTDPYEAIGKEEVRIIAGPPPSPKGKMPLALGDSRLLSALEPLLAKKGVIQSDIQLIFDELRSSLLDDLAKPDLKTVHSITLACSRCPNLVHPARLPVGNLNDPDLLVVIDNAVDAWPQELANYLKQAQFDLTRVGLTFATRCKAKRAVDAEEISNCFDYLSTEIMLLKPKLIITMGSATSSQFIGPMRITDDHGKLFWSGPWAIMPVYALNYLERKTGASKDLVSDLLKAKEFLYG